MFSNTLTLGASWELRTITSTVPLLDSGSTWYEESLIRGAIPHLKLSRWPHKSVQRLSLLKPILLQHGKLQSIQILGPIPLLLRRSDQIFGYSIISYTSRSPFVAGIEANLERIKRSWFSLVHQISRSTPGSCTSTKLTSDTGLQLSAHHLAGYDSPQHGTKSRLALHDTDGPVMEVKGLWRSDNATKLFTTCPPTRNPIMNCAYQVYDREPPRRQATIRETIFKHQQPQQRCMVWWGTERQKTSMGEARRSRIAAPYGPCVARSLPETRPVAMFSRRIPGRTYSACFDSYLNASLFINACCTQNWVHTWGIVCDAATMIVLKAVLLPSEMCLLEKRRRNSLR